MPTYRKLHTKIIDSYDFAEMPDDFTRVFWMLLIVTVDSEGRAIDNPAWLRSKMFPIRNDVTLESINCAVEWLGERGMINRYQVNGRNYFYIPKFKTYQSGTEREAKSVLPPNNEELTTNSGVTQELVMSSAMPSATATASVNASVYGSECVKEKNEIFSLYEQNIGAITPMMADELKDAEKEFSAEWIRDAITEGVKANVRKWKYIRTILDRWKVEGRGNHKSQGKPQVQRRSIQTANDGVVDHAGI